MPNAQPSNSAEGGSGALSPGCPAEELSINSGKVVDACVVAPLPQHRSTPSQDNTGTLPESKRVLVLEDVHETTDVLMENGYAVTRITYAELMSSNGDDILGRLITGEFSIVWCQTPIDWYVKPRERRTDVLYKRVAAWITRASK